MKVTPNAFDKRRKQFVVSFGMCLGTFGIPLSEFER
jgi:hypothetical protein